MDVGIQEMGQEDTGEEDTSTCMKGRRDVTRYGGNSANTCAYALRGKIQHMRTLENVHKGVRARHRIAV